MSNHNATLEAIALAAIEAPTPNGMSPIQAATYVITTMVEGNDDYIDHNAPGAPLIAGDVVHATVLNAVGNAWETHCAALANA